MAQYVFSMNRVGKIVPPKRQILKDISLSFFPGAKIGVLGLNGSGKSTLLKIMAGIDKEIEGEAIPMPGIRIGYLPQEPQLNNEQTVREAVEDSMGEVRAAQKRLDEVYAAYAEPDADFDALAAEQAKLEAIIATAGTDSEHQLEIAADALRLPPWDARIGLLSGGEGVEIGVGLGIGGVDLVQSLLGRTHLAHAVFHRLTHGLLVVELR
ncbi:MAG: ATP-binding cassette domain-containing protein, partial [Hydrogenophaga sp.]